MEDLVVRVLRHDVVAIGLLQIEIGLTNPAGAAISFTDHTLRFFPPVVQHSPA